MQTKNVKPDITVTVRHENVTDSLRQYAEDKINGIHLDYPRIIGAKAILDVEGS
ncbi:MAG TPA: ribosomal subunit interface protein, partial [Verrucomicrobiales bacterium]|nr:ribosomal subunit interface protein [Verrucomicrobiales bacterium]